MNLLSLTAVELGKKIKAHEVTVEEATKAALDAIRAKEAAGQQLCHRGRGSCHGTRRRSTEINR